jgi:hypothetical protein
MVVPTPELFEPSVDRPPHVLLVGRGGDVARDVAATFYWRATMHRCTMDSHGTIFLFVTYMLYVSFLLYY